MQKLKRLYKRTMATCCKKESLEEYLRDTELFSFVAVL